MLDWCRTGFRVSVDLQELGANGNRVTLFHEVLRDDTGVLGENVDGDLVSLDLGDSLVGLNEIARFYKKSRLPDYLLLINV